ncbi:MAG TPA: NAD(P)/FAD-dependent oxidoreductase [Woeseiaceae bacterium]|nr:NAD(P)/FAD-dependent oxidoreductase [Woeseiaceae bacterium]
MKKNTINIVGAGQCGALVAIMLAKHDYDVHVYERFTDPRVKDAEAGRSINLALAARGLNALRKVGIDALIRPMLVPMRGRMVHQANGKTDFLPYGQKSGEEIYSVTRLGLNQVLLGVADDMPNLHLHFQQNAIGFDAPDRTVHVRNELDGSLYQIDAQPLLAADGAGSTIRRSFDGTDTFGGIESLLSHGYKELSIPAGPDGEYQLAPDALHIWPRGGFMLIALPNPGGDFTLTLFLPNHGTNSFDELKSDADISAFFEEHFADAAKLIPNLCDEVLNHPLGLLGTVRCRHWHDRGNVLLLGDAAHAIVPFHGQGMNLAFEDCVLLERIVTQHRDDWPTIFAQFEAEQLANANAIADMALDNYVEMRDTVRDPKFALRKELAFELERSLPQHFIPRYSMVMFHEDIPYLVAQQRGELQKALLEEFTNDATNLSEVDIESARAAVVNRLVPIDSVRNELSFRK